MQLGLVLILLAAAAVFAAATWGTLHVESRRFYRRNWAGVEEFEGYRQMLLTRAAEKLALFLLRPVQWLAGGMALSCIVMLLTHR
jgi:hypothetical protein